MQQNEWDLPPPPGTRPVRGPRLWRYLVVSVLLVGLLFAAWLVPIPVFYAYLPGPVRDIGTVIDVSEATTYSSEGKLLMTTVSVDTEVTLFEMIASFFDPNKTIVEKQAVTGGESLEELRREQQQQMRESQQHAQEVALGALGLARVDARAVRIEGTFENAPAEEFLREGDSILTVDGHRVRTHCDVGRLIDTHDIGERVTITVERAGRRRSFTMRTIANPSDPTAPFVGIAMRDVGFTFEPEVDVDFDTGEIAGPSAGLMLALAVYDELTPDDLTAGRTIAGTGEIQCDGGIGPIGGIEQKVAGAEAQGADLFLAPAANAAAARRAATDIEVIAVATFSDALEYLEALSGGGGAS